MNLSISKKDMSLILQGRAHFNVENSRVTIYSCSEDEQEKRFQNLQSPIIREPGKFSFNTGNLLALISEYKNRYIDIQKVSSGTISISDGYSTKTHQKIGIFKEPEFPLRSNTPYWTTLPYFTLRHCLGISSILSVTGGGILDQKYEGVTLEVKNQHAIFRATNGHIAVEYRKKLIQKNRPSFNCTIPFHVFRNITPQIEFIGDHRFSIHENIRVHSSNDQSDNELIYKGPLEKKPRLEKRLENTFRSKKYTVNFLKSFFYNFEWPITTFQLSGRHFSAIKKGIGVILLENHEYLGQDIDISFSPIYLEMVRGMFKNAKMLFLSFSESEEKSVIFSSNEVPDLRVSLMPVRRKTY